MVDRADVTRYTDAARAAVDAAERQLAGFLAGLDLSQPGAAEALAAYMEALAQQYGTVAAAAAADWYEELRAADGLADGFTALVDDTISSDALRASTGYQLRNGDPDALASRLGGVLQRHILGAGRGYTRGSFSGTYTPAVSHAEVKEAVQESLHSRGNNAVFRFDEAQPKVKVSNIKYVADLFDMGVSIGFRF